MTRTIRMMSKITVAQKILMVGWPMAMAIQAREVDDETMAMAITTCSVGFVAISRMNLMPGARATTGGVNAEVSVRRARGGSKGVQE